MSKPQILPALPFDSPDFVVKWDEWIAFRKEQNWGNYKPIGLKNVLKDLIELSNNDEETAIAIIDQSLRKGWRGLFKLKDNGQQPTINDQRKESVLSSIASRYSKP